MNKVKTLKLLPIIIAFPCIAFAETTLDTTFSTASKTSLHVDTILPQLSLKAQQERATELMKDADYALQQIELRQEQNKKFEETKLRIRQEIGGNTLLLDQTTIQLYLDNQLLPLWSDKRAEKVFLREYALFAVSGVSPQSARALEQILNQPEGIGRDILLTDSFLNYLYYSENVFKNANTWLYDLGSYRPKAPSAEQITLWINSVKEDKNAEFITHLIPQNHLYLETTQKVLDMVNTKQTGKEINNSANNLLFYKLALNAQRLRILPNFDNGIFVNIPSYQLHYFRNGVLTLQSKVIVGRKDRRTPVMYSKLSNIVVNPPWNVPTSIMTKDIIPKLAKDPSYAERSSIDILDNNGNQVDAYSVNWEQYVNAKSTPYRLRQKAGDDSALGRYKFNMPSSDAIYLHDTPNRGLFGRKGRALSSGCVRVEKSDELATILLKEAGWSVDKKSKVLASKKTTSSPIYSDNPVYLYYVTTWVENGKIHSLPDIYTFDKQNSNTIINWEKLSSFI